MLLRPNGIQLTNKRMKQYLLRLLDEKLNFTQSRLNRWLDKDPINDVLVKMKKANIRSLESEIIKIKDYIERVKKEL